MKNILFILALCGALVSIVPEGSHAQKKVLTASEVSQLFVDKSMNIVGIETDKHTGKPRTAKAYASEMGGLLVVWDSGGRQTRSWSVNDDGAFCIGKALGRRTGGMTCGYVVPEGNGVYKMYKAKHVYTKDGRVVGGKQIKLLMTFSNLQDGNTL